MNNQNKTSIWDRFLILLGLKRDWKIIESKKLYVTEYSYYDYDPSYKFNKRDVTNTCVVEKCLITGKERGRMIRGLGSGFGDYTMDANKARAIINE